MKDLKIKNRHRLSKKKIRDLSTMFQSHYGPSVDLRKRKVDQATAGDYSILIIDDTVMAFSHGDSYALTVRGLLAFKPDMNWVTVDMGAVRFVTNGADIMSPGIVDTDPGIATGDLVWVRDERNKQPLAVGEALIDGPAMVTANRGKAVRSIHYVGDSLWHLGS